MTTTPVPQYGGTVTFTDHGLPIDGCADLPVNTTSGSTTCTPDVAVGIHTFGGAFSGEIGYAASQATPLEYTALQPQTITFGAPTGVTYADSDVPLGATASSALPVTYSSSTPDVCTTAANALHVVAAGTCTVTAAQAGDATYAPAEQTRTFTIGKARLTVTADDKSRPYGSANPALTATLTGFVGDDTAAAVSGSPVLGTTATIDSPPGEYPVTVSVDGLGSANYDFVGVPGTLTITRAPTTTTVTALPDPSDLNEAVTLTARVTTGSSAAPTGTVEFFLVGSPTPLASAPIVNGLASVAVLLPGGDHTVVAAFGGDDFHAPSTSAAPAGASVECTRVISGVHDGTLRVRSGTTCVLPGASVEGSIIVGRGASLSVEDASVGAVVATSPGAIRICGSSADLVRVSRADGFVMVGDPDHGCASNTVAGVLMAFQNAGGLAVIGNAVGGGVIAFGNSGAGPLPGQEEPVVTW